MDSRLRGNDGRECPPEADRGFGGAPPIPFFLSPKTGGSKGVDQATYGNRTIIPTGQWSDPVTSGMMKALATDGAKFFVTKK